MSSVPTTVTAPGAARTRRPLRRHPLGLLYVAPFVVLFAMFLVWPTIYGLWLSLTDRNLAGVDPAAFIGLANYAEAFADPVMWRSLGNTVWFTVLTTVPLVVLPLAFALLVNLKVRGQWLWRLAIFMPFLLASTVVSQICVWLLNPDLGLINATLARIGITGPAWLQDPSTAMYAVVMATVWWTVGFNFLLYLTSVQAIPAQIFEAAAVDGASGWRQLVSITLPLLRRTTALVVALQVLASIKVFDQIYQMTGGGPENSTRAILMYVYDTGFSSYRLGYASAISYIFFAIVVVLSLAQFRLFARRSAS
ncbi:binding-protein-dependent transport systems inner membrane component [Beutenbergia cavernae DSM 12333]|uniref:Binding-protein-dependent transport systems inner membrane component n=1 Tax=Beutenbergia cavernae (strain ATCC BAA-8 / DSM 12333 / CCUG 43141 / JCM 11478 / NBRC 16432 / NCIMB 13614 / HKI 0122) TaxID=471853 RepID=C5BVC8_BEUC1|nr:sugar ABC transporter permease [Beutenbergia cavernae]ACQ80515.1 binding-protein-dependent transport systems inner membrane component [Beutenbergia cavernae DSM 12333]